MRGRVYHARTVKTRVFFLAAALLIRWQYNNRGHYLQDKNLFHHGFFHALPWRQLMTTTARARIVLQICFMRIAGDGFVSLIQHCLFL
mgnify:CR=1 FL=1